MKMAENKVFGSWSPLRSPKGPVVEELGLGLFGSLFDTRIMFGVPVFV